MSWLLAATLATATAAAPVDLKRAEEFMAQYKYAEARAALTKARAAKGLDRTSLLRILELQGLAAGQLRQAAPATAAFRELLVLDPGRKLEGDLAPRVTTPFMEAGQAVIEQGPLEFRAGKAETTSTSVTSLSVEVGRDPLKLARSVVFHVRDGGSWKVIPMPLTAGRASVAANGSEVSWWVELVGDNDAQLLLIGSESAPQIASPPAPLVLAPPPPPLVSPTTPIVTTAPATTGGGVRTASYVVMGTALVGAGVGTFFGIKANGEFASIDKATRNEAGVITSLTEQQAATAAANGARDGTIANACFIGAGALAAGGLIMFLVGGPVAVAPAPGGVVVSGRFP